MNFYNKGKMYRLFNYYTLILIIWMTKSSSVYLSKTDIDIFLFLRDTDIHHVLENTLLILCLGIHLLIDLGNLNTFDTFHTYLYNPHVSGRLFDHHGRQSDSPSLVHFNENNNAYTPTTIVSMLDPLYTSTH